MGSEATSQTYDVIIANGRYFDGSGGPSAVRHLGIRDGRIAAVSATPLDAGRAAKLIDATDRWVTPGFLDTHTHYDAEAVVAPSLSESVRHGVTTALVGSCSLSMVCSAPEDASEIFTRVETVPREKVLPILKEHKTWTTPAEWVRFVQQQPLGPNPRRPHPRGRPRRRRRAQPSVLRPELRGGDLGRHGKLGLERLVNRNPGRVEAVLINGRIAFADDAVAPDLGKQHGYGQFLPACT